MRLRIISGFLGGRFIKAPDSKFTRPTTDRVRETLFNILNNIFDFEDKQVLDLYSGSGSLGFECLSRGGKSVDFVEKNFPVYNNLLGNINSLGVEEFCKIIKTSALVFTSKKSEKKYDLIFADPPFFEYDIHTVVENILKNEFLTDDGIMIVERSIQTQETDEKNFGIKSFKRIGDTLLYKFCREK